MKSEDCYLCLKFEIPLDAVDGLEGLVVITCKRPYNDNLNCGFIRNLWNMNLIPNFFPSYSDKISLLSVTISLNLYSEGSLKFFGKLFALRRKREPRLGLVKTHTICYLVGIEFNFLWFLVHRNEVITILPSCRKTYLPLWMINFLLSNWPLSSFVTLNNECHWVKEMSIIINCTLLL